MNEAMKNGNAKGAGEGKELWGVLVEFEDAESLLPAVERVRDAGFKKWDVHSPLPLHGLDDAMGLDFTKLPWITLAAGLAGVVAALLLQWYTNAYNYPIIVSGKPFFSLPANIPVTFEVAVLFAAVATVGGLFALNGLPLLYHPLFRKKRFRRVTSDRFFITIKAADPKFDPEATMEFLESLGGSAIERVEV
jgi:hypothetical protein